MSVERWIRLIAGTFILISLALSQLHSIHWLWFTAFVGANLFQSALTGWCPMEDILRWLGVREHTVSQDVRGVGSDSPTPPQGAGRPARVAPLAGSLSWRCPPHHREGAFLGLVRGSLAGVPWGASDRGTEIPEADRDPGCTRVARSLRDPLPNRPGPRESGAWTGPAVHS
jgi:hypothetical protein